MYTLSTLHVRLAIPYGGLCMFSLSFNYLQTWGTNTDALLELDSFLTGPDVEVNGGAFDLPMSDTSSDSGCNLEQPLLSPVIQSQDEDDEDTTTLHAVNPRTNSPEPTEMATTAMQASSFETGATTIILPVITPVIFWTNCCDSFVANC